MWLPGDSVVKNSAVNEGGTGYVGLIPGLGRFPRGENGNPLQYSCLKNLMDRGAWGWGYITWGLKELDTTLMTEHAPRITNKSEHVVYM